MQKKDKSRKLHLRDAKTNPSAKRDRVNLSAPGDTGLGKLHTLISDQTAWDKSWHQMERAKCH